eukprot:COSAG02_NODE_2384_length_8991_cov_40.617521_5_plen_63_part_00
MLLLTDSLSAAHRMKNAGQELSDGSIAAEEEIERVWAGRITTEEVRSSCSKSETNSLYHGKT